MKVKRNVYGQKQVGRVWNQYLTNKLINKVGFTQPEVGECQFYRGNILYVLYTDDSIILVATKQETINDIKAAGLEISVEGNLQDFHGANIQRREDGSMKFRQPNLERQVCKELRFNK